MPSLWMSSPFLLLPLVLCAEHGVIGYGMSLWSVGISWHSCVLPQLLVQHQLCGRWRLCRGVGERECRSYGCFGWEDSCAQSHILNGSMELPQLAIRQVPSCGGWGWGTWDMTCSSVTEKVKRAAESDDPGSHSFATGSSACMLLISLIWGAIQGWCQLQCLERPPHEAHALPTPSDYLYISFSRSTCFAFMSSLSPPFQ